MKLNLELLKRNIKQAGIWLLRKDAYIFLLFVGLVTLFWWGRSMTTQREIHLTVPITYTNIPYEAILDTPLEKQISVTIRDNGRILRKLKQEIPNLTIDLGNQFDEIDGSIHLSADILRPKIQDIFPGSTKIQRIYPEVIETHYHIQSSKYVPIALRATWSLAKQYQLASSPIIEPKQICIFGDKELLNTIDSLYTDSIYIEDINGEYQEELSLVLPQGIRTNTPKVSVTLFGEQFTDKTFVLPIQVQNVPQNETLHVFPQEVSIIVRVGISHFNSVKSSDFQAICTYPTTNQNTLPIQIIHQNPYVTLMRTNIREVEYIIER